MVNEFFCKILVPDYEQKIEILDFHLTMHVHQTDQTSNLKIVNLLR